MPDTLQLTRSHRIYTLQVYNRIVHETEKRIRWYYPAVIGVLSNVLTGFAQGLLIAFLLWQLTPILLAHSKASASRSKWTILLCRTLTWLINFVNAADTIVTAMLWVMEIQQMFSNVKANNTEDKVNGISTINDAALTAGFTGMFLLCVVIFAAVAQGALKHLSTANKRFKVLLCLLTAAMIFRSLLDFVWALVFKVWALRQKLKFQETLTTNLVHTVLYGLFSVIIYASIVYIATLPLPPPDGEIDWQHLPEKERRWHLNRNSFRKRPEAVAQEVHKGSWTEAAATTTVEELMPKRDEFIGYNGDPRYVDPQFLEAERTKWEEKMHREETDNYTRRFHGGAEYRPAGVQGRY